MTLPVAATNDAREAVRERFYAPELDGLRFIAALLVIIHHSPVVPGLGFLKQAGWIGVDLFLCISGYLLTRLLRLEYERTGTIRIRNFFVRRALRIWPLYFGYAALMSVAGVAYFGFPATTSAGWLLAHLSFSANLLTALADFSPIPFTAHLWTISLEEQAYFVLPFLLLTLSKADLPRSWIWIGALAALAILYMGRMALWLNGLSAEAIFVTPFRADGLVIGAAAALVFERRSLPGKPAALLLASTTFAAWLLLPEASWVEQAGLYAFPLLVGGCAIILLATLGGTSFLGTKPLAYLGKISFGIYVFHPIAVRASERLSERAGLAYPWAVLGLIMLLSIVMAALSYRLYETPFLRLKERFAAIGSRPV